MQKLAIGLAWLVSGFLIWAHWSLAVRLSYGLKLWALLEGLAAFVLIVVVLVRMTKRQPVAIFIPLIPALLSAGYYVSNYPYYVNRLVERVGPAQLVKDTAALCGQYSAIEEQREREDWKRLNRNDPRLPQSLRQLHPAYVTVSESSVDLKMGGWLDEYQGIKIEGEATPGEVDWTQTWKVREYQEGGKSWTRRVIAPGVEWETWSAP